MKTFYTLIVPAIALERFRIVTHSYVASYSIKTCFYETNSIYISKTKQNYTKPLAKK